MPEIAEELEVFQKHTSDVRAEYEPAGPTENFLVSSISDNLWRIARIRALEAGYFRQWLRREHLRSAKKPARKPRILRRTCRRQRERVRPRRRFPARLRAPVGTFFHQSRSLPAATANAAAKPPRAIIAATVPRIAGRILARNPTPKPHKPRAPILKTPNS